MDAFRLRVRGQAHQVEVGNGLGEAEFIAVAEPVAVPALVPAFDEDAAKTVPGGEVDILLRVGSRRAMCRALGP